MSYFSEQTYVAISRTLDGDVSSSFAGNLNQIINNIHKSGNSLASYEFFELGDKVKVTYDVSKDTD